jgi:dihydrofolate reductase
MKLTSATRRVAKKVAGGRSPRRPPGMLGLVDEYRFVVGPIVAGEGRRLLEGVSLSEKLQLKLVDTKIFKSGCVALRYLKQ